MNKGMDKEGTVNKKLSAIVESIASKSTHDEKFLLVWGISFRKINTFLLSCFLLLTIFVSLLLGYQVSRGLQFDTDLRTLLPNVGMHDLQQMAADRLLDLGGNHTVLMVGAEDVVTVKLAAASIVNRLAGSSYWQVNKSAVDGVQFQQYVSALQDYRFQLLSRKQKTQLQQGGFGQLVEQALYQLYQPSDWARVVPPSDDPLNLFGNWLTSQRTNLVDLNVEDGYLLTSKADSQGRLYGIVLVELLVDPFALDTQQLAVDEISAVFSVLPETVTAFRSGVLFHTAEATGRAKREVSIIALGSVIGIVLLYLLSFRSLWPLSFSLCAIFFGSAVALTVVHATFGEIHLITLVFGASLIGVAVDYALHFLSRLYHVQNEVKNAIQDSVQNHAQRSCSHVEKQITPKQAIVSVFPGITLGLITTIMGYLCLIRSDMVGLHQIALFSIVGLIAAWLFVVVIFPLVFRRQPVNRFLWLATLSYFNVRLWQKIGKRQIIHMLWFIFPFLIVVGAMSLQFEKDIRTLHRPSLALLSEGKTVQQVLNAFAPNQFFVVVGENPQTVLEMEESFQQQLNSLVSEGVIGSFDKVSNYLPSISKQRENYNILKDSAYGLSDGVVNFMRDLGVEAEGIVAHQADFSAAEERFLSLSVWQAVAPVNIRSLWLGDVEGRVASVITLAGIENTLALQRAASFSKQVIFVDRVDDISQGLLEHGRQAALFLLVAYCVIAALLLFRYRQVSALLLVSIPLLSSLIALTLFSLSGVAISLFHIFGLFLVLGLGIDYGLFIREAAESSLSTQTDGSSMTGASYWIAINLSAITSCLSFGLMSLSSTPMVSAFGMTVLIGSVCNLLLVPLVTVLTVSVEGECA
ncbi:MAG: MMPL family transporter [Pseudomonadales bacterium]